MIFTAIITKSLSAPCIRRVQFYPTLTYYILTRQQTRIDMGIYSCGQNLSEYKNKLIKVLIVKVYLIAY